MADIWASRLRYGPRAWGKGGGAEEEEVEEEEKIPHMLAVLLLLNFDSMSLVFYVRLCNVVICVTCILCKFYVICVTCILCKFV